MTVKTLLPFCKPSIMNSVPLTTAMATGVSTSNCFGPPLVLTQSMPCFKRRIRVIPLSFSQREAILKLVFRLSPT